MNFKIETKKGSNAKQDARTKYWTVTTGVEEASSWLCELDNACEQMAFKISHAKVGSEGSIPYLGKDVARDYVKGGITCLKCLYDITKSCNESYVDDIKYKFHEERYANNIKYNSNIERNGRTLKYESYEER